MPQKQDDPGAIAIAVNWLADYSRAVYDQDAIAFADLFLPNGWFRDVLVFDWDNRSLEGPEKIKSYLADRLVSSDITGIHLDDRVGLEPSFFPVSSEISGVEAAFKFEAPTIWGRGFVRLLPTPNAEWKALSLFMTVDNIKGHEEADHESGLYGGHTLAWHDVVAERHRAVEKDPQVLIVGAGQTGLQAAARFKQLGIRTITLERNARVGDNWRERYPTLTLHTPRRHHTILYAPYPDTWPNFTPRDKLAFWLEQYAVAQELVVWTSSFIVPTPTYDEEKKRWAVIVSRNGISIELHPAHIVIAAGTLGAPLMPDINNTDVFTGEIFHAVKFQGSAPFRGKKVIVLGAGNTAADVCQDLCFHEAASVTMVQRSETCVVSDKFIREEFNFAWPDDVPVPISDFKAAAMPNGLLKQISIESKEQAMAIDTEMHKSLEEKGLKLNYGPQGSGQKLLVFERLGGYWIDVGCADLIAAGKVKVKSGVEIRRFTEKGVSFTDGSSLEADVVIYATGYHKIRCTIKAVFGSDAIDRTSEVWGLDEEGEFKGCYRPSGHPGLWYAVGDFFHSRYMSKQLGLLILASELGLNKYKNLSSISRRQ